ncbi:MAG: SMI1/KNR4 family protein [Nannocystaceae bacterium]|nr:SMI1/KNR4 family protein [bacterium]
MAFATQLPAALQSLHEVEFDMDEIDYEPFEAFFPAEENQSWIRAWTGNEALDGSEYRVFGQDGTGGYAMFWLVRDGQPVEAQPVVFFGSEGEVSVIASNLDDYMWLLAGGIGPLEATEYGADDAKPHEAFAAFAKEHAPAAEKSAAEVLEKARAEFPDFEQRVRGMCGE